MAFLLKGARVVDPQLNLDAVRVSSQKQIHCGHARQNACIDLVKNTRASAMYLLLGGDSDGISA